MAKWEIRVQEGLGGSSPVRTRVNGKREAIYPDGTVMPGYMQMSQEELAESDREVKQYYSYLQR